jgi:hypothetical protein
MEIIDNLHIFQIQCRPERIHIPSFVFECLSLNMPELVMVAVRTHFSLRRGKPILVQFEIFWSVRKSATSLPTRPIAITSRVHETTLQMVRAQSTGLCVFYYRIKPMASALEQLILTLTDRRPSGTWWRWPWEPFIARRPCPQREPAVCMCFGACTV